MERSAPFCNSVLLMTPERLKETMGNAEVGAFALDDKNESRWILTGEIDISVHEKFREVWSVDRRSATPVDVDMSDVTFIDSSGLRILYDARRATPEDEVPTLTNVPERVRWIIDVTGLTEMFRLVPAAPES